MTPTLNLIAIILITQISATILLLICHSIDRETFESQGIRRMFFPNLVKIIRLFRETSHSLARAFYLLNVVFIIFSYLAVVLFFIYTIGKYIGLIG